MQLRRGVSEVGGVVGSEAKMGGGKEAASRVVGGHGNCFSSGATFFFQGASMTKWSVRSHRVYKHSFHE
jgi:hypothetical protein